MKIETELIDDPEDALYGKFIHIVRNDKGYITHYYSSSSSIPNEMNPEFNKTVEGYLNSLK